MEDGSLARPAEMPSNRLMTLLQQAVAFQIERGRYHPKARKSVSSFAVTRFFFLGGGGEGVIIILHAIVTGGVMAHLFSVHVIVAFTLEFDVFFLLF